MGSVKTLVCGFVLSSFLWLEPSFAQQTGFTYQGRYEQDGVAFTGTVDLYFSLWDSHMGGNRIGEVQERPGVEIVDGTFNTIVNAEAEFGEDAFMGEGRWLEVWICETPNCVSPEVLTPRQPITRIPYSTWSSSAPWSGLQGVPEGFADGVDHSGDSLWTNKDNNVFYNAGKVGVGSDTPNHQLRISGGPIWTSNGWNGSLELDNAGAIGWRPNAGGKSFGIGQSGGGLYFFHTASAPSGATSEADYDLTINDSGYVGIGTTSVPYPLTVRSPGFGFVQTDGIREVGSFLNGSGGWLGTKSNDPLHFFTNNSLPLVTLSTTGLLGVGTTEPSAKLDVVDGRIRVRDSDTNNRWDMAYDASGQHFYIEENASIRHLVIKSGANGSVGIGTTNPHPATRLNVATEAMDAQAIRGDSLLGTGVVGTSSRGNIGAVAGLNAGYSGIGVYGEANNGPDAKGVWGYSDQGFGVYGQSNGGDGSAGVLARGGEFGLALLAEGHSQFEGARFQGDVTMISNAFVQGNLRVFGEFDNSKSTITIDHPVDPENAYLSHASVTSSELKDIYDGNVRTDDRGYAIVSLPDWFEALNRDFRYQLTVVDEGNDDSFVQVKVVKKIESNQFTIRTSKPNIEISWQVTGVRNDPYARANPVEVVKEKTPREKGKYLAPEVYGHSKEKRIHYKPELELASRKVPIDDTAGITK